MYLYEVTIFDNHDKNKLQVIAKSYKEAGKEALNSNNWSCITDDIKVTRISSIPRHNKTRMEIFKKEELLA